MNTKQNIGDDAVDNHKVLGFSGIASPLLPPVASALIKADRERNGGMRGNYNFNKSLTE